MYTLGINTATQNSSVCLLKETEVLGEITWNERSQETKFLIPSVDELLKKSGIQTQDLEQLIIVSGPGPFTGLRIGVVLANSLAQNLERLKVFELNTFQFLLLRSKLRSGESPNMILINAGGEMVFELKLKNRKAEELRRKVISKEVKIQRITESKASLVEMDLSPKQVNVLGQEAISGSESLSFAEVCVKLIEENKLNAYSETEMPVLPYYVKDPSIN